MSARKRRGKPPGFPGCPTWMPPAVFTVVLVLVVYLLHQGYSVESITFVIISVTTAACEVVRRLSGLSGDSRSGQGF